MKRITVDLDEDLYKRVKVYCAEKGLKITEVIRALLVEKVEARKNK